MLIAATGVGAGDLAAAGIAGSKLGMGILWAVLVGAFFKFILTEGLTRWQLATGSTLLEGAIQHFGWGVKVVFGTYFLFWSFVTAAALMSACGVTMQAMVPTTGVIRDALPAGISNAAKLTSASKTGTPPNVSGSVAVTP